MERVKRQPVGETCPLCGSDGLPFFRRDSQDLRSCCCLWQRNHNPKPGDSVMFEDFVKEAVLLSWAWASEEDYARWYVEPNAYPAAEQFMNGQGSFKDLAPQRHVAAKSRLRCLKNLLFPVGSHNVRKLQVLDIGCGPGEFVDAAISEGIYARGVDPYPDPRKAEILQGTWENTSGIWNIVTMFDVFEHLTRPRECLNHMQHILADDGILVIEMPELGCRESIRDRAEWKHIRPRQHVCLYSQLAAEELFRRHGFEVLSMYRPLGGSLGKITWLLRKAI